MVASQRCQWGVLSSPWFFFKPQESVQGGFLGEAQFYFCIKIRKRWHSGGVKGDLHLEIVHCVVHVTHLVFASPSVSLFYSYFFQRFPSVREEKPSCVWFGSLFILNQFSLKGFPRQLGSTQTNLYTCYNNFALAIVHDLTLIVWMCMYAYCTCMKCLCGLSLLLTCFEDGVWFGGYSALPFFFLNVHVSWVTKYW